jgi:hypothetical protein
MKNKLNDKNKNKRQRGEWAYRVVEAAVVVKAARRVGGLVAVLRRLAERADPVAHVRIVAADRAPIRV